jgi:hypothetical protein
VLLARRNLLRDRTRFVLSVLGVAVSVGLILLLSGYRAGGYRQASACLDNTPGNVLIAELSPSCPSAGCPESLRAAPTGPHVTDQRVEQRGR